MKPKMSGSDFRTWRETMNYTQAQAAKALGISTRSVSFYERGQRSVGEAEIPLTVALACSALTASISPFANVPDPKKLQVDIRHLVKNRELDPEVFEWLLDNEITTVVWDGIASFRTVKEAVFFKLRWC